MLKFHYDVKRNWNIPGDNKTSFELFLHVRIIGN